MSRMEDLLSSEESGKRAVPWGKLAIAGALVVLLVLAMVLPPLINLGKYRRRITASMSEAFGRPVFAGSMRLRLLPVPGIVMTDFTVEEDPAFGYEPALHANSVAASLRLTSLWRGRLEVSRISLDEANLNLVRNGTGQWSIASVLLRASQIPNAPTGERHAGLRPRFPYIEATNARIDFKEGVEKKPFSLMNAEFAMWQASGDEWRLRLLAQPVRTDLELHLSDTGTVRLEGSLRRADNLKAMPVDLRAEWTGAQLGQVTRLIAGMDSGWRGDLNVTTTMRGTGGDLLLETRVRIGDLRRQEFQPATAVNVDANCRSEYRHAERTLRAITCFWPVGNGHLLLTGNMAGMMPAGAQLQLEINQVPASFPVTLLGLMRPHAGNVTATGTVNGSFAWGRAEDAGSATEQAALTGDATATGVSLTYPGGTLTLPPMHFAAEAPHPVLQKGGAKKGKKVVAPAVTDNALVLDPMAIAMGQPKPLVADARLTRAGFELRLAGDAALARLMPAGRNFGLLGNALAMAAPRGRATLNTTTTGAWMPPLSAASSGIATAGTVEVGKLELRPSFLPVPVEMTHGVLMLRPDTIGWSNVQLEFNGIPVTGGIEFPANCAQPPCPATFAAEVDTVQAGALEKALAGSGNGGLLGELFSGGGGGAWPAMAGTLRVRTLELGPLALQDVTATMAVEGRRLTIQSLEAQALGGAVTGSGEMTVSATPQWKLQIQVKGAQADEGAALFHERWGGGVLSAETHLAMSGTSAAALASSATGDFAMTWQNGGLGGKGASQTPLGHFDRWTANGTIGNSVLTLTSSEMLRSGRTTAVEGTIGFDRSVHLTLGRRAGKVSIEGTLEQPEGR